MEVLGVGLVALLSGGCATRAASPAYAARERHLVVALPGQSVREATWHAEHAGIFSFLCTIPAHMPEMYGQIVVLPAAVGAGFADSTAPAAH
jgi:hypothetical protein